MAKEQRTDGPGHANASGTRRAVRRKLPFGHGARLEVGQRTHIVGLADVSTTGAYLVTGVPVRLGDVHVLKLVVFPGRPELVVHARVVRIAQAGEEAKHHARGFAVEFVDVDPDTRAWLETFARGSVRRAPAC